MNKRKINIRNTYNNDLVAIFKNRLDKFGYSTWKEFTDTLGVKNGRAFIDFFNGKQCLSKEILEKAFELLKIPTELLDIYTDKVIRYKIKKVEIEDENLQNQLKKIDNFFDNLTVEELEKKLENSGILELQEKDNIYKGRT